MAQSHTHEAGIQTDNDSYLGQGSDRYYTNGLFLFYRQSLALKDTASSRLANKVLGFEAGQKMYNSRTGDVPDKRFIDRPIAAYLYAGATLNLLYKNESNLKLGLQTGVIGPAALGKEAQELIHNTFGFYKPRGWEYQVRDNFQFNLSAEYNRLISRGDGVDLSIGGYGNLGTGFIGAGVGPMLRLGNFNQFFNSVSTQSTASVNTSIKPLHPKEFFFYIKPVLNYVGYDATVEGSIFGGHDNSDEVLLTPNRLMLSNQLGVSYVVKRWVLDASATFHTKDVKTMVKAHQWASVTALYRFN